MINYQYIKDLSFEAPKLSVLYRSIKEPPSVKLELDRKYSKLEGDDYEVTLSIRASAQSDADQFFLCELTYAAVATVKGDQQIVDALLLIEVPRFIFPFARNILADVTRESGMPPLIMNPVDFNALYQAQKARDEQTVQ